MSSAIPPAPEVPAVVTAPSPAPISPPPEDAPGIPDRPESWHLPVRRIRPYAALGAVLALVLIMAKLPMVWPMGGAGDYRNWLAITAEDAAWALVVWALGTVADRLLSKKPRLQLCLRRLALGLAVVAVIYSVANVGIFRALKQPLNSRILAMIEHVGDLGASLAEYWNWKIMCGMIAAPVFLWGASRALQKVTSKGRFQRWFWVFRCCVLCSSVLQATTTWLLLLFVV